MCAFGKRLYVACVSLAYLFTFTRNASHLSHFQCGSVVSLLCSLCVSAHTIVLSGPPSPSFHVCIQHSFATNSIVSSTAAITVLRCLKICMHELIDAASERSMTGPGRVCPSNLQWQSKRNQTKCIGTGPRVASDAAMIGLTTHKCIRKCSCVCARASRVHKWPSMPQTLSNL